MNSNYMLEENQKILKALEEQRWIPSMKETLAIRAILEDPFQSCPDERIIDRNGFREAIFCLKESLDNYYNMAKSVNSVLIFKDDGLRKQFLNVASVLAGNTEFEKSLRESRFPELENYLEKHKERTFRPISAWIMKREESEDRRLAREQEQDRRRQMLEDIGMIVRQEYYQYGLRMLRDVLLEINCSRLAGDAESMGGLSQSGLQIP